MDDEGTFNLFGYEELESHKCSLEELGFEGKDSKFFPVNRQQKRAVQATSPGLLCVDRSNLEVFGGEKSNEKVQTIQIMLLKCTNDAQCKSDEEIDQYFRKRQMHMLSN